MSNTEKDEEQKPSTTSTMTGSALIGRLLGGKYRIIEKLGHGGMGVVYKAEHTLVERIVAIKILHSHLLSEENFLKRFHREAKVGCKINHQNAVTIWDFGVEDQLPYIVMEYVQGTTLKEVLARDGALPLERCVKIFRQIGGALSAAHELGIIHRDLKPDNVMLTREGTANERAQVLDFGIAKLLNPITGPDGVLATRAGTLMGTPAYISPEQALEKELDARSDIYSLGIILYEMLSGDVPFKSTSPIEICVQHVQAIPSRLCEFKPGLKIPTLVSNVVMKALEKEPKDRFQSVEEMVLAFEQALLGKDKRTFRPPQIKLPKAPQLSAKRSKKLLITLSSIVGAALLAFLLFMNRHDTISDTQSVANDNKTQSLASSSMLPDTPLDAAPVIADVKSSDSSSLLAESSSSISSSETSSEVLSSVPTSSVEAVAVSPLPASSEEASSTVSSSGEVTSSMNSVADFSSSSEIDSRSIISLSSSSSMSDLSSTETSSSLPTAAVANTESSSTGESSLTPLPLLPATPIAPLDEKTASMLRQPLAGVSSDKSKRGLTGKTSQIFRSGEKHLDEKNYAPAALEFRQVLEENPSNLQARLNYGLALMRVGEFNLAIEQFTEAVTLDADYAPTHYSLASAYALSGQIEPAFEALAKARIFYPGIKKWLLDDADFNSLRADPRFLDYLDKK